MKQTILIAISILLVVGLAVGAYVFFASKHVQDVSGEPDTENPFGTIAPGELAEGSLGVKTDTGSTVVVPDFTQTDQPEWAGDSAGYKVAGSESGNFLITYIPGDAKGSPAQFLIALLTEPLGETRLSAEAALRTKLNLTDAQLCNLDTQVWTQMNVSEVYAGQDLGLSFCEGSIRLP